MFLDLIAINYVYLHIHSDINQVVAAQSSASAKQMNATCASAVDGPINSKGNEVLAHAHMLM